MNDICLHSARSVQHAAHLAGGDEALAQRLGVEVQKVLAWSSGAGVPTMEWLRLLDVIICETRRLAAEAMAMGLAEMAVESARAASKTAQ